MKNKINNELLNMLVKKGSAQEQIITDTLPSLKKEEVILPEKNEVATDDIASEKKVDSQLSEKKETGDKKNTYASLMKKRIERNSSSIEKANLFTQHRDMLKKIGLAEKISIQDLMANILDDFFENYSDQIKQSTKKLF